MLLLCGSRGGGISLDLSSSRGSTTSGGSSCTLLNISRGVLNDTGRAALPLPLRGTSPLLLAPRSHIAQSAASRALANTAKLLWQVLGGNLTEQILLITASEDVNLLNSDGIEPSLDHVPDGAKAPGGVDQVQPAETLRVVVLAKTTGLLDITKNLGSLCEADALEVHDGTAGLEEGAGLAAARGEAGVGEALVLDREIGKHALARRDLVHGVKVDAAELLDVNGATVLVDKDVSCQVDLEGIGAGGGAHFSFLFPFRV